MKELIVNIILIILLGLVIVVAAVVVLKLGHELRGDNICAYCHNQIKTDSDVVIFSDGRRAHLECAWRERGESNDT